MKTRRQNNANEPAGAGQALVPALVGGICRLLDQLPAEMLQIIIAEHLPSPADLSALSRICRAMHGLIASLPLQAAWMWSTHGAEATFMALRRERLHVFCAMRLSSPTSCRSLAST